MKIPVLNIYIFTKKSFQKKQKNVAIATRAVSNKLLHDFVHENALLKLELGEMKRKGEKK